MSSFGNLLKRDREALGWSQEQLGKEMGVSQQTVGQWESDAAHPRRHRMQSLLALLNTHLPGRSELSAHLPSARPMPTIWVDPSLRAAHPPTPVSRAAVQARLRESLPEALHGNVGRVLKFGQQEKQYDYVSPAVVARVLPSADGRPPLMSMAVLTVHLAMVSCQDRRYPGPEATVGLFVITPDLPAVALKRLGTSVHDAHALGVEVIPVPDVQTMGHTIAQLEAQYAADLREFNCAQSDLHKESQEEWQRPDPLPDLESVT